MRAPRTLEGGFTLVELLSAIAVSSIVLLALAGAVISQSRTYDVNARTREAIASSRRSVGFLEAKVRMAGFGIHPIHALDFGAQRDFVDAPDELVVRYREPSFRRRAQLALVGGAAGTTLALENPLAAGATLRAGQILMLVCVDGSRAAYVRVAAETAPAAASVELAPFTGNFPDETPAGCLLAQDPLGWPFVVLVDQHRFFVRDQTLLVESNGVEVPIAAGVEDLQIAYLMNEPEAGWFAPMPAPPDAAGDSDWIFGDVGGTAEQPDPNALAPALADEYRGANRFTGHPANVRAIRVTVVARSDREYGEAGQLRPAAENRPAAGARDGFFRSVVTHQIFVPNLLSRSIFAPVEANVGGS